MTREYFSKAVTMCWWSRFEDNRSWHWFKTDFIKVALVLSKDVWLPAHAQLSSYLSTKLTETHSPGCWFLGTIQPWHYIKTVDSSEFLSNENVFSFKNISSLLTPVFPIFVKWLFGSEKWKWSCSVVSNSLWPHEM